LATLFERKIKTDGIVKDLLGKHNVFAYFPVGTAAGSGGLSPGLLPFALGILGSN
jgi:hypothetical protein